MNQIAHAQILARLVNTPLLLSPDKGMVIWNALCGHFGQHLGQFNLEGVEPQLTMPKSLRTAGTLLPGDGAGQPLYRTHRGVAVIPIMGSLINRGAWVGSQSGTQSYEGLRLQVQRARADDKVRSVLFDIDSPGGEASGALETSAVISQLSTEKPTMAVVNGLAASAGYALAAGSRRIVMSPSGIAGHIGCLMMHIDVSEAAMKAGVKPTIIFSGEHKADGNPFEALPESVRGDLQSRSDHFYSAFLDRVAEGRRGRTSRKAARDTQARIYVGQDAIDARLADSVGSLEEVLDELASRPTRSRAAQRSTSTMAHLDDDQDMVPRAEVTAAATQARADAEAQAATRMEAARAEAETAAYARMSAIMGDERVKGHEAYALKLAIKSPTLSAADVAEMVAELPKPVTGFQARPVAPVAERAGSTGADAVSGHPVVDQGDAQASADGWNKAVERVNSRNVAGSPAARR